jgi:cell filamentation protein
VRNIRWRWEERDFGFRFRSGQSRKKSEYYQGAKLQGFYVVPPAQRKLKKARLDVLETRIPDEFQIVTNPWRNYEREWDLIQTEEGICLNYAGCLDRGEIERREDEGVARAMEYVVALLDRPEAVPLTLDLIKRVHIELMGAIYPFAGNWRTIPLHKGEGATKWPYPPGGIGPVMEVFERDVLERSPFISDLDEQVFMYTSEVMSELLAIHPFREGNGRMAFIVGNLILMQNSMFPLDHYERKRDQVRYFNACEDGRIRKNYEPLAELIAEWEDRSIERWEDEHAE